MCIITYQAYHRTAPFYLCYLIVPYVNTRSLSNVYFWLLLIVRRHLIGSQVITRCSLLFVVNGVQAVVESRSAREIDNIPQVEVQYTLKGKNRTRGNTYYVFKHSIEEATCSPSETIKSKCPQSANMYM